MAKENEIYLTLKIVAAHNALNQPMKERNKKTKKHNNKKQHRYLLLLSLSAWPTINFRNNFFFGWYKAEIQDCATITQINCKISANSNVIPSI